MVGSVARSARLRLIMAMVYLRRLLELHARWGREMMAAYLLPQSSGVWCAMPTRRMMVSSVSATPRLSGEVSRSHEVLKTTFAITSVVR